MEISRRHVAGATIGNALEFYDFLVYTFFSIQIGHAFFPAHGAYASLMLSLATFGAGFITRPIGAIVIGNYADRRGRRPAMMLCFLLIGFSIIAMALIPTYSRIGVAAPILAVTARMVQGFSLGGEVGATTAFLLEAAPAGRRGLIVSWQGASQQIALILGGGVGMLLTALLPAAALDAYGWRAAFLLGAVVVPFGFWLRSQLPETLHAADAQAPEPDPTPSRAQAAYRHRRVILLGLVVLAAGTIGSYIFSYMVTYAQATLHMSALAGFTASTCGYLLAVPAMLLGGWLSDRYGRWPINFWGNLLFLVLLYPTFAWIVAARTEAALIVGTCMLSLAANFPHGSFYAGLAESLPRAIRGSGFGISYAFSIAAFGGTTQLIVTWLIHDTGSAMAPCWYLIAATGLGQLALLAMVESAPVRTARLLAQPLA